LVVENIKAGMLVRYMSRVLLVLDPEPEVGWAECIEVGCPIPGTYKIKWLKPLSQQNYQQEKKTNG